MNFVFEGVLLNKPFKGELFKIEPMQFELITETDFAAYYELSREEWPHLMSFSQRNRFLTQIYEHIRNTIWDNITYLLMVARVPSIRMPLFLEDEKIIQVVELTSEIKRLDAFGVSFVSLYEGFIRYPLENGNNEFRLEWHNPKIDCAVHKFDLLTQKLRENGLAKKA